MAVPQPGVANANSGSSVLKPSCPTIWISEDLYRKIAVVDNKLNDNEQRVWRSFNAAHLQLVEHLDRRLQQNSRLTLTDYQILEAIDHAPDGRVRMSTLASRLHVSRSRLTYRVDRLEEANLLHRQACADDGRGLFAVLTPEGLATLAQLKEEHTQNMRTWFFDEFDGEELNQLAHLTDRLNSKLAR